MSGASIVTIVVNARHESSLDDLDARTRRLETELRGLDLESVLSHLPVMRRRALNRARARRSEPSSSNCPHRSLHR
jgi:hypothetical protein